MRKPLISVELSLPSHTHVYNPRVQLSIHPSVPTPADDDDMGSQKETETIGLA